MARPDSAVHVLVGLFTACCVAACSGLSGQCRVSSVMETKLVQARGRINAGGLGCIKAGSGPFRFGLVGRCLSGCFVACRAMVSTTTRSARFRLRRRMVGCTKEWCGGSMLGLVRLGEAWLRKEVICGR